METKFYNLDIDERRYDEKRTRINFILSNWLDRDGIRRLSSKGGVPVLEIGGYVVDVNTCNLKDPYFKIKGEDHKGIINAKSKLEKAIESKLKEVEIQDGQSRN